MNLDDAVRMVRYEKATSNAPPQSLAVHILAICTFWCEYDKLVTLGVCNSIRTRRSGKSLSIFEDFCCMYKLQKSYYFSVLGMKICDIFAILKLLDLQGKEIRS